MDGHFARFGSTQPLFPASDGSANAADPNKPPVARGGGHPSDTRANASRACDACWAAHVSCERDGQSCVYCDTHGFACGTTGEDGRKRQGKQPRKTEIQAIEQRVSSLENEVRELRKYVQTMCGASYAIAQFDNAVAPTAPTAPTRSFTVPQTRVTPNNTPLTPPVAPRAAHGQTRNVHRA